MILFSGNLIVIETVANNGLYWLAHSGGWGWRRRVWFDSTNTHSAVKKNPGWIPRWWTDIEGRRTVVLNQWRSCVSGVGWAGKEMQASSFLVQQSGRGFLTTVAKEAGFFFFFSWEGSYYLMVEFGFSVCLIVNYPLHMRVGNEEILANRLVLNQYRKG